LYGLTGSLRGGRLASGQTGGRHPYRAIAIFGLYIAGSFVLPGRKRVVPYSIQTLKRLKPSLFREDLTALFKGGVIGKIVLVPNALSLASTTA